MSSLPTSPWGWGIPVRRVGEKLACSSETTGSSACGGLEWDDPGKIGGPFFEIDTLAGRDLTCAAVEPRPRPA